MKSISIIPEPNNIITGEGEFTLPAKVTVGAQKELVGEADFLINSLKQATGYDFAITPDTGAINLHLVPGMSAEAYKLKISDESMAISASDKAGIFYGIQTMRQLFDNEIYGQTRRTEVAWRVPCLTIEDAPRFKWRGIMLDISRHFFSMETIKKHLDYMAMHKLNVFHWHLVDAHGWRIEIKKYPKLTSVGAWRKKLGFKTVPSDSPFFNEEGQYGGFFTQEQIREVVAYATERHITVVPEIELPGHCRAALVAYPEFSANPDQIVIASTTGVKKDIFNVKPETFKFLEDVLLEVMELFPGEFIHIGGDEARKEYWQGNEEIQAKIKELGLKDEDELQSWFIRHFDKFLQKHNRRLIGWDEILEGGLAPGAAVMSWRGEQGGITAANAGHDVVMTPQEFCYLDWGQGENEPWSMHMHQKGLTLEKVYSYEPVASEIADDLKQHLLGAQCNIWTEFIPNEKHLQYMTFPRACAFSEVVWSAKEDKNWDKFKVKLIDHLERLRQLNVNYRFPKEIFK